MQQNDLFEYDPHTDALIDRLDQIPPQELVSVWPQMLGAFVDVLEHELKRQVLPEKHQRPLARKLAAALATYMGGRSYYLPNGEQLFAALRNDEIYSRFNGKNIEALRREYGLGQVQIYKILAQQRQLHTRRHQPDLFATH
ncbi:transcriptional regulator [Salmonella enterica subsp. enterica serovar Pomona]|nr:transcriptional regulator [Salmonella enterica subsp. enterica serovar Pomona]